MIIHVGAAHLLAESLTLPLSLILPRIFLFAAERMVWACVIGMLGQHGRVKKEQIYFRLFSSNVLRFLSKERLPEVVASGCISAQLGDLAIARFPCLLWRKFAPKELVLTTALQPYPSDHQIQQLRLTAPTSKLWGATFRRPAINITNSWSSLWQKQSA